MKGKIIKIYVTNPYYDRTYTVTTSDEEFVKRFKANI